MCIYFWIKAKSFSKFSGLFPKVVIIILGTLSVLLIIQSFIKSEKGKPFREIGIKYNSIIVSILLMISWVYFINVLGFVTTSVIFFSIMYILLDRKTKNFFGIIFRVLIVIALVGIFYLFFAKLLLVPFPEGMLF